MLVVLLAEITIFYVHFFVLIDSPIYPWDLCVSSQYTPTYSSNLLYLTTYLHTCGMNRVEEHRRGGWFACRAMSASDGCCCSRGPVLSAAVLQRLFVVVPVAAAAAAGRWVLIGVCAWCVQVGGIHNKSRNPICMITRKQCRYLRHLHTS